MVCHDLLLRRLWLRGLRHRTLHKHSFHLLAVGDVIPLFSREGFPTFLRVSLIELLNFTSQLTL